MYTFLKRIENQNLILFYILKECFGKNGFIRQALHFQIDFFFLKFSNLGLVQLFVVVVKHLNYFRID